MREGERELPALVTISLDLPRDAYTLLKLMSLERRGHRQFTPFIREHLLLLASRYSEGEAETDLPEVTHTDYF